MNMATPQPDIMSEQLRQTTCPYCGVGCGVDISCNASKRAVTLDTVKGTPEHPANFGRLCVKGTNLLETNGLNGRLLHPTMAGKSVDWDTATVVSITSRPSTSTVAARPLRKATRSPSRGAGLFGFVKGEEASGNALAFL